MAGIDRNTGKLIEEPAHIKQSIEVILTTPAGTRVMRPDMGVTFLSKDGAVVAGVSAQAVEDEALMALAEYEPRIRDIAAAANFEGGLLNSIDVSYIEKSTSNSGSVLVVFSQ